MPKTADYSKGFIYKIVCKDITISNIYVGSSTDWVKRKSQHKSTCNNENDRHYKIYFYQFMRSHGGWNNWTMLKICNYPCNNKFELCNEERYYMELLQSDLNKQKPQQTLYENDDLLTDTENKKAYDKQYRLANEILIKDKKNAKHVCLCGGRYNHSCKAKHESSLKHKNYIILKGDQSTDELVV